MPEAETIAETIATKDATEEPPRPKVAKLHISSTSDSYVLGVNIQKAGDEPPASEPLPQPIPPNGMDIELLHDETVTIQVKVTGEIVYDPNQLSMTSKPPSERITGKPKDAPKAEAKAEAKAEPNDETKEEHKTAGRTTGAVQHRR